MSYYFYCPTCGHEEKDINKLPQHTIGNTRGGYGIPIHHYNCPQCNNPHAGYMLNRENTMEEYVYYRSVIGLYQEIQPFKVKKEQDIVE